VRICVSLSHLWDRSHVSMQGKKVWERPSHTTTPLKKPD